MSEENATAEALEQDEATTAETPTEATSAPEPEPEPEETEEISYQAVEKDGAITAIWEMQGQKHIRTIDPRSREGLQILELFTAEIHETGDNATA